MGPVTRGTNRGLHSLYSGSLPHPSLILALGSWRSRKLTQPKGIQEPTGRSSTSKLATERDDALESLEDRGRWAVLCLYEALRAGDGERARQLLGPDDMEWWFHGPKENQRHLISLLSGEEEDDADGFVFEPQSVAAFGSTVVVEGCHGGVAWVHAWTVSLDGLITKVREYFNTSVTVTLVGDGSGGASSSTTTSSVCRPVWQSRVPEQARKSLPGLVLAI